jgi:hypothetical protein
MLLPKAGSTASRSTRRSHIGAERAFDRQASWFGASVGPRKASTLQRSPFNPTCLARCVPSLLSWLPRSCSGTTTDTTTARSPQPSAFRNEQWERACGRPARSYAWRLEKAPSMASHLRDRERCLLGKSEVRMPIPERNTLGPGFEKRLKAALDRVTPPSPLLSSARYRSGAAKLPRRAWRLVAVLVAVTATGAALTAAAATGSTNPVVWTERAGSAIESVSKPVAGPNAAHTPRPEPSRETSSGEGTAAGRPTPSGREQEPERSPAFRVKSVSKHRPVQRPATQGGHRIA